MVSRIELQTPRLVLRPFSPDEEDVFFRIESDPKIQPQIDGVAERRKAHGSLEYLNRLLDEEGYSLLAVTLREGGKVIGIGGLLGSGLPGALGDDLQVLVAVTEEGFGYGTETATAALDWGFRVHGHERILGLVRPDNDRSLNLIARLSGRHLGDAPARRPEDPRMLLYEFLPR